MLPRARDGVLAIVEGGWRAGVSVVGVAEKPLDDIPPLHCRLLVRHESHVVSTKRTTREAAHVAA